MGVDYDEKKPIKVYVPVSATFDSEGRMLPRKLRWEDGKVYTIDQILEMRPAPSLKAGGQGDRYTIRINGQQSFLFFERNPGFSGEIGRWFVERK
ncbi:MAG: hypothetical protein ACOX7H_05120 [Bacillota bacterium]|jgi:hypothetical protein